MKLSKRLACIANEITKIASFEDTLADIGCDHGYLPCFLVENKVISFAWACDIAEGPLSSSKETIKETHTQEGVKPLLGNGLDPVVELNPRIIVLAGMGGFLMEDILDAHIDEMSPKYIIIQANICIHIVRACLNRHGYKIKNEVMVEDAHHIYEVLVYEKGEERLTERDLKFGKYLPDLHDPLFIQKWEHELEVQKRILPSLNETMPRYLEVMEEIKSIEGVLNDH